MNRKWLVLVLLTATILFGGCNRFNLRQDKIPVPPKPEWCAYRGYDMSRRMGTKLVDGVWFSDADNDTLIANIESLRLFCDKLEAAVRIYNGENPTKIERPKNRK